MLMKIGKQNAIEAPDVIKKNYITNYYAIDDSGASPVELFVRAVIGRFLATMSEIELFSLRTTHFLGRIFYLFFHFRFECR